MKNKNDGGDETEEREDREETGERCNKGEGENLGKRRYLC